MAGGVLYIPNERDYPASVALPSTVLKERRGGRELPFYYNFKKGVPLMVEEQQDYDAFRQMMIRLDGGREVFLFRTGVPPTQDKKEGPVSREEFEALMELLKKRGLVDELELLQKPRPDDEKEASELPEDDENVGVEDEDVEL